MTFVFASQFHIYLPWDNARLALCLNTFLNKKALLGTFNQEKALVLVGAFSVIVKTDGSFAALIWTEEVQLKCGAANKFPSLPFNPPQGKVHGKTVTVMDMGKLKKLHDNLSDNLFILQEK